MSIAEIQQQIRLNIGIPLAIIQLECDAIGIDGFFQESRRPISTPLILFIGPPERLVHIRDAFVHSHRSLKNVNDCGKIR